MLLSMLHAIWGVLGDDPHQHPPPTLKKCNYTVGPVSYLLDPSDLTASQMAPDA